MKTPTSAWAWGAATDRMLGRIQDTAARVKDGFPHWATAARRAAACALLAAAWLSAGAQPFAEALRGARAPADFTRDFVGAPHTDHTRTTHGLCSRHLTKRSTAPILPRHG